MISCVIQSLDFIVLSKLMEIYDISVIRNIVEELISRLPEDCAEIAHDHFEVMLEDIRRKGLEKTIQDWFGLDQDIVLVNH
ncbi:MAG: hypothetical protein QXR57_06275 [Metallosphaera sp.]|nr:hypothetical protein [Metallosphaera cuprina]